jgi:hypothetical protein
MTIIGRSCDDHTRDHRIGERHARPVPGRRPGPAVASGRIFPSLEQESAVTITLTRPAATAQGGRHRLGRPGLVPAPSLVVVVYRGWLSHLVRPGRHLLRLPRNRRRSTALTAPAVG